jgi:hypothetical protein
MLKHWEPTADNQKLFKPDILSQKALLMLHYMQKTVLFYHIPVQPKK